MNKFFAIALSAVALCAVGCTAKQEREFEAVMGTPAERQAVLDKAQRETADFVDRTQGVVGDLTGTAQDEKKNPAG